MQLRLCTDSNLAQGEFEVAGGGNFGNDPYCKLGGHLFHKNTS